MPRRKQSKGFEALHKARWTARTGSSTATSISPTIAKNNDRNEVGSLAQPRSLILAIADPKTSMI